MKHIIKIICLAVVVVSNPLLCNTYAQNSTTATADSQTIHYKDSVINWLKSQLSPSTPVKNGMVNKILQNAEYDKMYIISRGLIVPIKRSFFSQHISRSGPLPFSYLMFSLNKQGGFKNVGDVMLVYPADKTLKALPKNTLPNFYSQEDALDGTYTLISVYGGDHKVCEMDIKGGERAEIRGWTHKKIDGDSGNRQEWFLQTDIIEKGVVTKTTTKSLGKSSTVNPPKFKGDKRIEGINQ